MPQTRFLIACEARTGSNWLCGLLNSHPDVLCHHEVFHPDALYYAFGFRDGRLAHLGSTAERDRDPRRFARELLDADFGRSAVGFKILGQQAPGLLRELLADASVKKLILRRRNRVRAFVSLLRARQTGHWAQKSYDGIAVRVDPRELAEYVRDYDEHYRMLREATQGQPALELVYEDLQQEPRRIEDVLRFLGVGVSGVSLSARNARQSQDGLESAIENHAELCAALRGGPLADELREAAQPAHSAGT